MRYKSYIWAPVKLVLGLVDAHLTEDVNLYLEYVERLFIQKC